MATIQTGVDQYRKGGYAHDAAQDVAATATQLIEVVEGLPAHLNPDAAGHTAAVSAFWDGVGALATANGYTPA